MFPITSLFIFMRCMHATGGRTEKPQQSLCQLFALDLLATLRYFNGLSTSVMRHQFQTSFILRDKQQKFQEMKLFYELNVIHWMQLHWSLPIYTFYNQKCSTFTKDGDMLSQKLFERLVCSYSCCCCHCCCCCFSFPQSFEFLPFFLKIIPLNFSTFYMTISLRKMP